jgi:hypothetical protein
VTAVSFGINSDQVGDIRALDVGPVEEVLSKIVEFVGEDPSFDSDGIVGLLSNDTVGDLGEPPNSSIAILLPFLYH